MERYVIVIPADEEQKARLVRCDDGDASKSNAIYGRSATVQPAAYYVHIWRRVA